MAPVVRLVSLAVPVPTSAPSAASARSQAFPALLDSLRERARAQAATVAPAAAAAAGTQRTVAVEVAAGITVLVNAAQAERMLKRRASRRV